MRHFIDLNQINKEELFKILKIALDLKNGICNLKLPGKNLAMIFEKSSTRTRVSFEVGINQLGGHAIVMNHKDMQLGKGETIADTAKVLSRFVDAIMLRCNSHQTLIELAENSTVPVLNALSDYSHPCQIMASVMAIFENFGAIQGKTLGWFGDANNVLNSYIHAAAIFGYSLRIAVPQGFDFCNYEIEEAISQGAKIKLFHNAAQAAETCDVLITDTWVSMGQEAEKDESAKNQKLQKLMPFQVNQELMQLANQNAIFTHCLPAYRGYEVTKEVIDSSQSIVFDEAENRLHAQKAILLWCFGKI